VNKSENYSEITKYKILHSIPHKRGFVQNS